MNAHSSEGAAWQVMTRLGPVSGLDLFAPVRNGGDDGGETRAFLLRIAAVFVRTWATLSGLGRRLPVNRFPPCLVPTAPTLAIGAARRRLSEDFNAANAVLIVDALPQVMAEPEALTEIFAHLIGNALRGREPSRRPVIHIFAAADGAMVALRVRDNGLGLDPHRIRRLFDPVPADGDGPGPGLAGVGRLIERMGGRIWVDLIPGREGTTIGFALPASSGCGP